MKTKRIPTVFLGLGLALALMIIVGVVLAGPSTDSGFEGDDGNLAIDSTFDWNGFTPVWPAGGAPYRQVSGTVPPWGYLLLEDDQVSNDDTAFSGGTKQDDECATLKGAKAPNKDDLKRAYLATATVGEDVYLALAWARIPQNSTSASAHVAFEFNKSKELCANSDPEDGLPDLVVRTPGDMLIVYDFEGGDAAPTIKLSRWTETAGDPCDTGGVISNKQPGCWNPAVELTTAGFAEAAVNTISTVSDELGPSGTETLGLVEFGEALINLTDAGVFGTNQCESFGNVFAVSRSSGNSAQAQMKDLVGPGDFSLDNCGEVIIRKVTDPKDDDYSELFDFSKSFATDPASSNSFQLADDGVQPYNNVLFGSNLVVTEDVSALPYGYSLVDIVCDGNTNVSYITDTLAGTVTFSILEPDHTLDCTYTNRLRGSVTITKKDDYDVPMEGITFTLYIDEIPLGTSIGVEDIATDQSCKTDASGTCTIDDVVPGNYWVVETAGVDTNYYQIADPQPITVDADNVDVSVGFVNPRLTGAIVISKTRKHAGDGPGSHPHPGVVFTIDGGVLAMAEDYTTNGKGEICREGLALSYFSDVDGYTITETLPSGYVADGSLVQDTELLAASTCADGNATVVNFSNTPLTNVTVSVDSQVDGGTASTIQCTDADGNVSNGSTGANGDGSLTVSDLLPTDPTVTLTCTITIDP